MKGKEIAILFFLIVVLAFYIFSEKGEKTHYELPEITQLQSNDISKIEIRKKGSEIVLLRENDKWLLGSGKYPADEQKVDKMIVFMSGLKLDALASEKKNYLMYELDDEKRIDVSVFKGDDLLRKISIGKPASSYRHTFVTVDDDDRVFHSAGNFRSDFDKTVSDFRDKTVMVLDEEITELVLKKGDDQMKFTRRQAPLSVEVTDEKSEGQEADETGPAWISSDGKAVKAEEIQDIIDLLTNLQCESFIEGKGKEDFQSPIFIATLKGLNTYSISLFDKTDGHYAAIASTSDYPFLISSWKANKIMKDFKGLTVED
jgi:hypothetical protein